jgi:cbb3-type cytochrome oxidase subunit 3
LGNLTDALHIPPQAADTAMKIILAYLLIGSYATLFWLWRQRGKNAEVRMMNDEVKPDKAP